MLKLELKDLMFAQLFSNLALAQFFYYPPIPSVKYLPCAILSCDDVTCPFVFKKQRFTTKNFLKLLRLLGRDYSVLIYMLDTCAILGRIIYLLLCLFTN